MGVTIEKTKSRTKIDNIPTKNLHSLYVKKNSIPPTIILAPSSVSVIVSKLIHDSHEGQMLARLKIKLGKTKEEIYKIVSEL